MKGAFCRCLGRRAALLHRDREGSPTGEIARIETGRQKSRPGGLAYREAIEIRNTLN